MTLKELRKYKKITQEEASNICHIPLRSYKRLESDESYKNSLKYANAYNSLELYDKRNSRDYEPYNIAVVGAGYVGFSTAVLLSLNNHVSVVDINKDKVDLINKRKPIFKDFEIEKYLKEKKLLLEAFLPSPDLYKNQDYVILALPTDFDEKTKLLNTENIVKVVDEIRSVNKKCLIIIKSTCYVGFTESLNDTGVIFCPEFLREGHALSDNLNPSRIIIGTKVRNKKVNDFAALLRRSTNSRPKVLFMSPSEAEATKLFSNAYLAMRVAYFNELDSFAIKHGIDSKNIIEGVSLDSRIGDYYNNPSFGYGGYCLPKDTLSLINQMNDVDSELITSIDKSNCSRKDLIVEDIMSKLSGIKNPAVGVYSLESKKDSDNIRHAAILDVIDGLKKRGVEILYFSEKMTLDEFKKRSDIILMNRYNSSFDEVKNKVYTRDIYKRD